MIEPAAGQELFLLEVPPQGMQDLLKILVVEVLFVGSGCVFFDLC